jgi:peptide/nickel transport system permease protein
MSFMPVVLWTDAVVYLLLAAFIGVGVYTSRKEDLRGSWRQIRHRSAPMIALVVLLVYVGIGLADSVHFKLKLPAQPGAQAQYAPEVLSLFDLLAERLRRNTERTYSAPLATHAYSMETVETGDGRQERVFPRLAHGGGHLKNPATDRPRDIVLTTIRGAAAGGLGALLINAVIVYVLSRRHAKSWREMAGKIVRGETDTAWRGILGAISLVMILSFIAIPLGLKYHLLGTDKVGQDVFYLSLKGIRTGLIIGILTILFTLPFAVFFGIAAGYFGGWIDDLIQYLYTTLSSVPGVLLIAASVLILQVYMDQHAEAFTSVSQRADIRLFFLCLILGMTNWIGLCRLLRGETLKLREMEYVQAAIALGSRPRRIIFRHLLPNVMHIILISMVLDFSGLVLAEAVLSYVGVGVDPAMISWGNMINGARLEMAREPIVWWSLLSAFFFMFGLVLPANIFSDAVRDAFDPRIRGSEGMR